MPGSAGLLRLRSDCVSAALNEGLDLLDMLGSQLALVVRHAFRGERFVEQDLAEILDEVLVYIAQIPDGAAIAGSRHAVTGDAVADVERPPLWHVIGIVLD